MAIDLSCAELNGAVEKAVDALESPLPTREFGWRRVEIFYVLDEGKGMFHVEQWDLLIAESLKMFHVEHFHGDERSKGPHPSIRAGIWANLPRIDLPNWDNRRNS